MLKTKCANPDALRFPAPALLSNLSLLSHLSATLCTVLGKCSNQLAQIHSLHITFHPVFHLKNHPIQFSSSTLPLPMTPCTLPSTPHQSTIPPFPSSILLVLPSRSQAAHQASNESRESHQPSKQPTKTTEPRGRVGKIGLLDKTSKQNKRINNAQNVG
jgi:hypothetical protein